MTDLATSGQHPPDEGRQSQTTRPRLWRLLRWIPPALMLTALATLLAMFMAGGLAKISAWYLLQFIPPLLGFATLVVVLIYAIVRRRFSRLLAAMALTALICLLPALMLLNPIAFPASLQHTEPSATVRLPADVPLNFAEGLPLYFRDHAGSLMPAGGTEIDGETAVAIGDAVQNVGD